MILCVTPNPAVDRTLVVPRVKVGEIVRASQSIVAAGGKGLNVARVAHQLGADVTCSGFLGGHSGRLVADLAEQAGLSGAWTWIDGETRTCVIAVDPSGHDATVFNEQGPSVTAEDWRRLHPQAVEVARRADAICVSGSLPPGSDSHDYARLLEGLRDTGTPTLVDTSGAALAAALAVEGIGIKINGDEASAIVGEPVRNVGQACRAARDLHRRTGGMVVLTLGAAGAVLANADGTWHAWPPTLRIVSTVGSGDAFLAGFVVGLTHGAAPSEALRRAVAAGAANALSISGGTIDLERFEEILAATAIRELE